MPSTKIVRARGLRHNSGWAERLMWKWLRDRRFTNYKFRRQHPVSPYTLDFFCEEAQLSIELDGGQHGIPENQVRDETRTRFLQNLGIKELRFWNSRLRTNPQAVRQMIFQALHERTSKQISPNL
jgi:very-short-patch-repair endonuclease